MIYSEFYNIVTSFLFGGDKEALFLGELICWALTTFLCLFLISLPVIAFVFLFKLFFGKGVLS